MTKHNPWDVLARDAARLRETHLRKLFRCDPERFARFTVTLDDLTIDFSKERIDDQALTALFDLARCSDVPSKRDAMLSGAHVNVTEDRAALHTALRAGPDAPTEVDRVRVAPLVHETLERTLSFAEDVRTGKYIGSTGKSFLDVVNIGIGGSDLGPDMVTRALSPDADGPRLHFVSNVDGAHLADTLKGLEPSRTLFVVVSKTFTTAETMTNARSARAWLSEALGEEQAWQHFTAVSTNLEATAAFGIDDSLVFGFWDWVGGRYSVWSAVGLSVAIAVGAEKFCAFLDGARAMDTHFATAPLEKNLPVLLALIGIWRRNAMGWPMVALIPYDQRLACFPAYVQQLDMESNGKRVTTDGKPVVTATAPVIWGEPGTNAQHSFFQLLHQGTDVIPVDFIVAAQPRDQMAGHHALLLANCLAQAQALAFGKTEDEVRADMDAKGETPQTIARLAAHRTIPGNRPSTVILYKQLDPYALGRLIALYEHKVFVQGAIWNVDSFDQWGVELGKQLATRILPIVEGKKLPDELDGSTAGLVARIRSLSK